MSKKSLWICPFCMGTFEDRIIGNRTKHEGITKIEVYCLLCSFKSYIIPISAEEIIYKLNKWCKEKGMRLESTFNEFPN